MSKQHLDWTVSLFIYRTSFLWWCFQLWPDPGYLATYYLYFAFWLSYYCLYFFFILISPLQMPETPLTSSSSRESVCSYPLLPDQPACIILYICNWLLYETSSVTTKQTARPVTEKVEESEEWKASNLISRRISLLIYPGLEWVQEWVTPENSQGPKAHIVDRWGLKVFWSGSSKTPSFPASYDFRTLPGTFCPCSALSGTFSCKNGGRGAPLCSHQSSEGWASQSVAYTPECGK